MLLAFTCTHARVCERQTRRFMMCVICGAYVCMYVHDLQFTDDSFQAKPTIQASHDVS